MRTTFDLRTLEAAPEGSVVSIGVFDGVHQGHQAILRANVARAIELGAEPTVVTFRRHPKRVILGRAPKTLTTLDHRLELFRAAGIRHTVALDFDSDLREQSAAEFTATCLIRGLAAKHFVLGFDSKFGHDRQGGAELLRELGHAVDVVGQVMVGRRPVSSTAIREATELGDLVAAAEMLGRPVAVMGRVIHGDARGRELGFPTANVNPMHSLLPPYGVYATRVRVVDDGPPLPPGLPSVTNVGRRPTVAEEGADPRVEVHLLDWSGDLYGTRLEVAFVEHLRDERRFEGLEALTAQMRIDAARAAEVLGSRD